MRPLLNALRTMQTTAKASTPSITAIVAATAENGIGLNGGLPWRLPGEMKYFARVTTGETPSSDPSEQNVVIMGRKTWESIPSRFRPLKNRRNVVISGKGVDLGTAENSITYTDIPSALSSLRSTTKSDRSPRIFLIGGSTLYTSSLLPSTVPSLNSSTSTPPQSFSQPLIDRILLTRILSPFECDAYLEDFAAHTKPDGTKIWKKTSIEEFREWIGWDIEEQVEEKGVKYIFEIFDEKWVHEFIIMQGKTHGS
ncbi:dihydrofolate reductase [Cryptococcus neoformans AD2-60a]|uniref:Dihydrofolate reductase n=1 Tax=Cryptococcus neoformans Tu259-1 TaxID=1230072 RepID=A0A854Q4Y9_CRYNE|nr:dihydrofolate reductase [Cryptococcus neoformans var. grubii AD2-60a]OWZ33767.1 dihydrofolate reductase [Cryptococcus neoformans var. grubii AD1-83a]OWZ51275.1 dihydrofolate reductase [Cryptococcus neoformans var. grubii 125.91]OXC82447.1 dihydrofolate reductase [Cryptococcus neoformans var. grubii AD1-7a]OXG13708.1 dihydrofolate reductase [Cryptococcus neoformans var. grubii Tu259-1]OXG28029.1 dihydrofolate reductase [Cryptococcus neoformans var. grubii Bt15]OXG35555.1 dihydrofolate reduc